MATALTLVNRVLTRLRENQVTSFISPLSLLILEFLNETKEEVENAWTWTSLRSNFTFQTSNSVSNYTITSSGQNPVILSVWNDTLQYELHPMSDYYYMQQTMTTSIATQSPCYYRLRGLSGNDSQITLFPTPNGVEDIVIDVYRPEGELSDVSSSTVLPSRPLILGTWAKAISERGEDGGQNFSEADAFFRNALADSIALDANKVSWETTWQAI